MTQEQRQEWKQVYRQYRNAGHTRKVAASVARSIAVYGTPF